MGKPLAAVYGVVAYAMFLATFRYAIGFVADRWVPIGIDSGVEGPGLDALLIVALLLGVFAVQHSVMARPGFKAWWTRLVPKPVERSTCVLPSNLALALLYWGWQPLLAPVWGVKGEAALLALGTRCGLGWLTVLVSTVLIDLFDLLGLRQVYLDPRGVEYRFLEFRTLFRYRLVRHPIMLGLIIAFWATPDLSVGHLLCAPATGGYILIALQLEERDLVTYYGEKATAYQKEVPVILPLPRKR